MVVDYSRTKIYSIRSPQTDKVYVGATTEPYLSKRMEGHRRAYRRYLKGKKEGSASRYILEYGDAYIQIEEKFPCNSIEESSKKEREWAEKFGERCINLQVPGRTKREWGEDNKERIQIYKKEYYKTNKEKLQAQKKEYYEKNKEKHLIKKKKSVNCPYCSRTIQTGNKARHFRSKRCQASLPVEIIFED